MNSFLCNDVVHQNERPFMAFGSPWLLAGVQGLSSFMIYVRLRSLQVFEIAPQSIFNKRLETPFFNGRSYFELVPKLPIHT